MLGANADPGAIIYSCMDWRHMGEMLAASRAVGWDFLNLCVWVKSNGGMGSFYRSRHELVFVFRNGQAAHVNNVQLGRFGRNRQNVWNYPGANSFRRKGQANSLDLHPTVKPVALVADAILDSTKRNDIVLDPFAGQRDDLYRCRADRSTVLRHRDRRSLCRHRHRAMGAAHGAEGAKRPRPDVRAGEARAEGRPMSASSKDYEVGYKRPPKETRWKKGQSGNPARRYRTRPISAIEMIDRLLLRPIEVVEKGETKKVTALEVIVRQALAAGTRRKPTRARCSTEIRSNCPGKREHEASRSNLSKATTRGLWPPGCHLRAPTMSDRKVGYGSYIHASRRAFRQSERTTEASAARGRGGDQGCYGRSVEYREGGRTRKASRREVSVKRHLKRALEGDIGAAEALLKIRAQAQGSGDTSSPVVQICRLVAGRSSQTGVQNVDEARSRDQTEGPARPKPSDADPTARPHRSRLHTTSAPARARFL